MKILYVVNALTVGGAQTLLNDMVKCYAKSKNEIYVAAFRNGNFQNEIKKSGAKVYLLGERFLDFIGVVKLIRLIRKIKPDVIHSHLFRASMWCKFASLFSVPSVLVTTVHGKESYLYSFLERFIGAYSDKIVFSSNYLLEWYNNEIVGENKNIVKEKESVLYPGTRINQIKISDEIRANYNPFTIGVMSRLHFIKGIDFFLTALSKVKNKDFKVLIAGDGAERDKLFALSKEFGLCGKCEFLGYIKNKKEFLERLNLFVSPSRDEGFGINVCEALERSVPVYASNAGGLREIIKEGYNGKLFEVKKGNEYVEKFAELLDEALDKKNEKVLAELADNGRKTVEKHFNREKSLEGYFEMYKKLLGEKNKKIHFLVSSSEMGGGERLALGLMKSLISRGYKVSLTCAGDPLKTVAIEAGVRVSCESMRAGGLFYALKAITDIIKIRPSYISSHLNKAGLIGGYLGKFFGIKTLAHVHGLNRLSYYKNSDKIIAVSKAVKDHICCQGKRQDEIELICNCIDKPALNAKTIIGKPIQIAITAKLHANKGHEWALKAISSHVGELNIGCIHVLGDGPEKERLHQLCSFEPLKSLVKFYGFVENVDEVYEQIDVALLPSAGEGIPLSLLEALRFGIPCIATNRGGIPEIITDGDNGLLVDYGDEKALVDAIKKLSNPDIYEKFSQNAIIAFNRLNNYEKMVDEFEKLL